MQLRLNITKTLMAAALLLLLAVQYVPVSTAASSVPTQPQSVVLTIIPPKLPSDGGLYPAVVVSLEDSTGQPTAALHPVTVFLTSSLTNIASVPDSVTIPAGHEYVIANVTTTSTPGTTMISAAAQGLVSKSPSPLTTATPSGYPSKLLVFTSPSTFLPRSDRGVVRVELVDDAGLPSKAITPVSLLLSSSNSSIATLVQSSLVIPIGSFLVDGSFQTSSSGSAVITAAATGYGSGQALVTVDSPTACTSSCGPSKLALRVIAGGSPGTLPTDGQIYNVLEVSLQTSSGTPAVSSSDIIVTLTSDSPDVASVLSYVTIPAGSISTLASVTTSALTGVASVTATSTGLLPANVQVQTVIPAPSKLQAYIAPPSIAYSTNGNSPILVVQLQDSGGNPARARQATNIVVTSSNASMIDGYLTLTIPAGSDYAFTLLQTKGVGTTVLYASSQDLSSSQVQLNSVPNPLVIGLTLVSTSSGYIYENETATFQFSASFGGVPLKDLNITWGTSGGSIAPSQETTGSSGSATALFTPGTFGAYNITASTTSPETGSIVLSYRLTVAQVPVKPPPSLLEIILGFWYYIVAAAAVVIVAVVYLFRMRRKKQRAEIEAGFEVV